MVRIPPEKLSLYLFNFLRDFYAMWSKRYKSIYVELHKMDREYVVLIGYKKITENSTDWIDRAEVVKTDRKYLFIVKKEILACNRSNKNGDVNEWLNFKCENSHINNGNFIEFDIKRLLDDVYGKIPAEDYKKLHDRLSR